MKRKIILFASIALGAALLIGGSLWYCFTYQSLELSLVGSSQATVEYGTAYDDAGAQGYWGLGILKFLSKQVDVTVEGTVDTNQPGTYELHYTAHYGNRTVTKTRTVTVADTVAPQITLEGSTDITLDYGTTYAEEGYTAIDNYEGDITQAVTVETTADAVIYTATDVFGNTATAQRTLHFKDLSVPVIKLKGKTYIIHELGSEFTEPGYSATDNCDGTVAVTVTGQVDTATEGTYKLTYTATDKAGNTATVTRTVNVNVPAEVLNPIPPTGKTIYLTFDDGPGKYTAGLLDVLKQYNAKATFFIVGNKGYGDVITRMATEGHTVAVHTYCHDYKTIYTSASAYWDDFTKTQNRIYALTGALTTLFRFPGGGSNTVSKKYCRGIMTELAEDAAQLGYTYFDWNVSSGDAGQTTSTDQVFRNVTNGIGEKNYAIVLQHDTQGFSVNAVEKILIWGLNRGYTFAALDATSPTVHHKIAN